LGQVFADARRAADPTASEAALAEARGLPLRAPAILCVISAPVEDPKQTPLWEQQLSAGAVCQNLMIAANAAGWAACWITEWPAFDPNVHAALGLRPGDQVAGFIYLGTAREAPVERQRPDAAARAQRWTG
jgi:nitroreductase